ncbi:MAG: hypothetical protein WDZ40_01575 [Candidatus Spechtbacterales bacterium]
MAQLKKVRNFFSPNEKVKVPGMRINFWMIILIIYLPSHLVFNINKSDSLVTALFAATFNALGSLNRAE